MASWRYSATAHAIETPSKVDVPRPRIRNVSAQVREHKGEVVFLRRIAPGAASRSYGIDVARLAGLPRSVVARARQILGELEGGASLGATAQMSLSFATASSTRAAAREAPLAAATTGPTTAAGSATDPILAKLRGLDPDHLTPMQALAALADLKSLLP